MIQQQAQSLGQEKAIMAIETPRLRRVAKVSLLTMLILVDFAAVLLAILWFVTSATGVAIVDMGVTPSLSLVAASVFVALLVTASMPMVYRMFSVELDY